MFGWLKDASNFASRSERAIRQQLDRHFTVKARILRQPDHAHPTLTDLLDQSVME
jgi:hypothetical protein